MFACIRSLLVVYFLGQRRKRERVCDFSLARFGSTCFSVRLVTRANFTETQVRVSFVQHDVNSDVGLERRLTAKEVQYMAVCKGVHPQTGTLQDLIPRINREDRFPRWSRGLKVVEHVLNYRPVSYCTKGVCMYVKCSKTSCSFDDVWCEVRYM